MNNTNLDTPYNRLDEVHRAWHLSLNGYHSVEDFRAGINSSIQSLRNVTFTLQKQLNHLDGFDTWYESWRKKMNTNPLFKKINDARVEIVHTNDLLLNSRGIAVLRNWEKEIVTEIEFDPIIKTNEVADFLLQQVKIKLNIEEKYLSRMVFELERIWIYKGFEDKELLSLISEAYIFFENLLRDAQEKFGIDYSIQREGDFCTHERDINKKLTCMAITQEKRTVSINPLSRQEINLLDMKIQPDAEILEKGIERYGHNVGKKYLNLLNKYFPSKKPFSIMKKLFSTSLSLYQKDKFFAQVSFLFKGEDLVKIKPLFFRDQQEKIKNISALVEEMEKNQSDSVMLVLELWIRNYESEEDVFLEKNSDNWDEAIEAIILTKEVKKIIHIPIKKNIFGNIIYGKISTREIGTTSRATNAINQIIEFIDNKKPYSRF